MAISLFFMLLSFAFSLDFSLNFPEKVFVNESFNVSVISIIDSNCDIKIFIKEKEASEKISSTLSFIFNKAQNKWQNSYFYLENAFPFEKNYLLKVNSIKSDTEICAKLRNLENKKILASKCQPIQILGNLSELQKNNFSQNFSFNFKNDSSFQKKENFFQTKENKIRNNIFFLFTALLLLILLLLFLRKI